MGFFKKIFKPVSKVLDKVIPNEIKPALPYLAAFAPFIAPGIMGSSVLQRAAMGGGLNIFGQLSQEGNEGDINLLSAGLGALSGAMSAPGRSPTVGQGVPGADFTGADFGFEVAGNTAASGTPSAGEFFRNLSKGAEGSGVMASGQRFLGDTLAKGSDMYAAGLKEGLFSKAGLKAAALPAATATGDLMFAQAKRDQDEYDRMMEEEAENEYASDASRALAIRQSMEAYGFTEDEILAAIEAAGYKKGGRVGFRFGGIDAAIDKVEDESIKESVKMIADMPDMDLMDLIEEFEITFKRKPMNMEELKQFYRENYEMESPVRMKEKIKEKVTVEAKDGGRIGFRDGSSTGNFGTDRYASELVEAYKGILDKGDMFFTDVEKELIEKGEYPSPDKMKEFQDRYENLEKEYEKGEDKFGNIDLQDSLLDKDAIKYYNKKVKDLEDREEKLIDKEEKLSDVMYTDLDVSGILRTPEFQEWYSLWKVNDPKADDLPNAEYFEDMMFNVKRLRPDMMKTKYDVEMKDGGRIGLREGGVSVFEQLTQQPAATQNAPMFLGRPAFATTLQQAGAVFPRLNQLEQGVNRAEQDLGNIRNRLGNEQRQGLLAVQPSFGLQPAFLNMGRLPGTLRQLANRGEPVAQGMKDGGMMDLGGKEMDLRKGGFVPIGKKERADDVPARLSKNEFVMTADAVRAAGGGSVNKGAKRMYNLMNTLEAKA